MSGLSRSVPTAPRPLPRSFVLAVAVLGLVLTVTVVPGTFTIDESNYLVNVVALRQGHVALANTAGLPPSTELAFFDPASDLRVVTSTPISSNAPPLYAPLALPFSLFGWRGLVALNTVAFLATIVMVFAHARRYAADDSVAWLAAGTVAFGGFLIEYAQGVWPHALSVALVTAGVVLLGRFFDSGRAGLAMSGGVLLALATGIRYQNAVLVVVAGGAVLLWGSRRFIATLAYGAGAALPLAANSLMNYARLGSWNPISKGPWYLTVPNIGGAGNGSGGGGSATALFDPLIMFWARLVDFSVRPPLVGPLFGWVTYEPSSGAHLMYGQTAQKALLQSAPWLILALALFILAWVRRVQMPPARRRQLQFFSLLMLAMLAVFAISGRARHEGVSFNQRYLLEMVPLAAVAFAWALDGLHIQPALLLSGVFSGTLLAIAILSAMPAGTLRLIALLKVPLFIAAALAVVWWLAWRHGSRQRLAVGFAGMALGWAVAMHIADDVQASRGMRELRREQTDALRRVLPDHSALFAYWGNKDSAGPLLLERDVVILDVHTDDGAAAPALVQALLARGRRVFVLQSGMPQGVLEDVRRGWQVVLNPGRGATIELRTKSE